MEVAGGLGLPSKSSQGTQPHPPFQIQRDWSDPRICVFNKFSGEAVAAGPANTVGNQLISPLFNHCLSYEIAQATSALFTVPCCLLCAQGMGVLRNPGHLFWAQKPPEVISAPTTVRKCKHFGVQGAILSSATPILMKSA